MNPFFSIIIPAYNVEKYIEKAIKSVINQDFQDYELIIINDGSIDKTADIINGYVKYNNKIKIINHAKNESLHIVRIDGVNNSNGKYLLFLDADDYFVKNALNMLFNEINKYPGYDFYEFGYIRQPSREVIFPTFNGKDRFIAFFSNDNCPAHTMWNKVYNSKIIKKAFASLERVYINNTEDMYESIVIFYYAKNIYLINKEIINYSIGTGISTIYKDYNKTLDYLLSVKRSIMCIQEFLLKINYNISLDDLKYRYLSGVINYYINAQKNIEEKKELFLHLPEYFDIKIIMKYLFNLEESNSKINLVAVSKEYRLGKILLSPLRRIKQLFK